MLVIVGIVLMVLAVLAFFAMRRTKEELYAMIGTDTLQIPELEDLRRISDDLGARGGFRKAAEVVGVAHPRPEGPLISPVSNTPCVWYRYRIDHEYEHVEYRDGRRRYSKRTEKVAEHTSHEGYALIDEQGRTIGVDPNGTRPDRPEHTVDRFEPRPEPDRFLTVFGIDLPSRLGHGRGNTIGYRYKEWLIRPGQRLFVLGEVHDRTGPLVIGKPERGGHFIISTRTEEELRAARVTQHKLLAVGVIAAFLAGLALTLTGILTRVL